MTSDAVPVHLMTREAMGLYAHHLRDRPSLIAVNLSNRYLALADVVAAAGAAHGFAAVLVEDSDVSGLGERTDWMLLSREPRMLQGFGPLHVSHARPWTDAWSDPWRVFHWHAAGPRL